LPVLFLSDAELDPLRDDPEFQRITNGIRAAAAS
jgi:hypothetical protein